MSQTRPESSGLVCDKCMCLTPVRELQMLYIGRPKKPIQGGKEGCQNVDSNYNQKIQEQFET